MYCRAKKLALFDSRRNLSRIEERGSFEELEILKNNKYNFKTKLTILEKF